jgi:hypothetical protein
LRDVNKNYRNILLVDSRSSWFDQNAMFDINQDIVLTFDFALKREIEEMGGEACYIDSLCTPPEMQKNNFLASDFFKKWHYDKFGNDIFIDQEVPFGFSFRIEIWSEYLYYVRLRVNLEQLKKLEYEAIYVGEAGSFVADILREMEISFIALNPSSTLKKAAYFFDIHQYMQNALRGNSVRDAAKKLLIRVLSEVGFCIDRIFRSNPNQKTVYAQIYHPTKKIVERLQQDLNIKVITSSLSTGNGWQKYFVQRLIPISGRKVKFQKQAELLLNNFRVNRCATFCLSDGTDITAGAYNIIEQQIKYTVPEALRILNSVINYVKKQPIHLEVMIANIGLAQTIVDCVLKTKGIPSYLIINGLLGGKFCDEGKYGTYINSYSESVKHHYFDNAEHIVCLGDPRMDHYVVATRQEAINRIAPTVTIGTSGFNNIDLISYVAIEFDFMFDILSAFQEIQDEAITFNLIIKVRPNGVLEQYVAFADEYFPKLKIKIVREVAIIEVLMKTDLYISIYSQTLFEASCLGIPVIYYKKDQELLDPPFDKKSELVTVDTIAGLKQAFFDFKTGHDRFNVFLEKPVMEKYVGPLDGKNLDRNLAFIYNLLDKSQIGAIH